MTDSHETLQHALDVVEFDRVLDLVASRAASVYGVDAIRAMAPRRARTWMVRELERVYAVSRYLKAGNVWPVNSIPEARPILERLGLAESVLDPFELRALSGLLAQSGAARARLRTDSAATLAAVLEEDISALLAEPRLEGALERVIAEDGSLKDSASPELRRIRRELRSAEDDAITLLERIAARLQPHQRVPDLSVTIREGRYVIAVRRDARSVVGGIVHDTSASGATLFVEPPAAVEHGNMIRELQAAERREVDRILRDLTEMLRPFQQELSVALETLVELDTLFARARFAEDFACAECVLVCPGEDFAIRGGRHPLLIEQGISVVPFTLEMSAGERTVLVSGPNTGGKTVLLKSVGVIAALVQSGIPAPVEAESRIPVFDGFFADVGDEQSIQASLSTFSAHLRNISTILELATAESLVLMDELGSGTDPVEGAALAGAVLEELTRRGALTLATSHLGVLQLLATELPGFVNASLQFDAALLEPTYRFVKGIPGRSYGISMARRLGLPEHIVARAGERVPRNERQLAAFLADMESRERDLASREQRAADDEAAVARRGRGLAEREARLAEREKSFERESRRSARRHLLESRSVVERTIRELKAAGAEKLEESARAARRAIEELASDHDARLREIEAAERRPGPTAGEPAGLAAGEAVTVRSFGGLEGSVLEVRATEAVVSIGALKATVPLGELARVGKRGAAPEPVVVRGQLPEEHVSSEIDLRGLRVDEVDNVVIPAIDAAARSDLRLVRIIHGKGTGALRGRVRQLLASDPRIASFRPGAWNEGGDGVTIVELR